MAFRKTVVTDQTNNTLAHLAFIGITPLDPTPTGMWSNRDYECGREGYVNVIEICGKVQQMDKIGSINVITYHECLYVQ